MSRVKEYLMNHEDEANNLVFELTMAILSRGKLDVLIELEKLRMNADSYAKQLTDPYNFKSPVEREIATECAKAGFLSALKIFQTVCGQVLRPDYEG